MRREGFVRHDRWLVPTAGLLAVCVGLLIAHWPQWIVADRSRGARVDISGHVPVACENPDVTIFRLNATAP